MHTFTLEGSSFTPLLYGILLYEFHIEGLELSVERVFVLGRLSVVFSITYQLPSNKVTITMYSPI